MAIVSAPSIAMVALRDWAVLTGSAQTTSRAASHWRRAILAAQVSASVVLLFMAAVMTRNLSQLQGINPGFARDHVTFARLDQRPTVAPPDNPTEYLRQLLERSQGLSRVKATAFALSFPTAQVRQVEALTPGFRTDTSAAGSEITAASDWVSPGFFEASGMTLVRGRDLSWQDVAGQPEVAVATAGVARLLFADADPVGRQSVTFMRTANEQTDLLLARERLLAELSSFFGALAVVVVTLGLYGLLSYSVAQRRREIGVRSALGATRTRILLLVVGEGLVITSLGIVAGVPLAAWARATAGTLLFQPPAVDAAAILSTIAVVALASGLASVMPARTAASLAPSEALRHL